MNEFMLYLRYISAVLRSHMEYRASFLLMVIGRFIVAFSGYFAVSFLFSGFEAIKGYTYADVLLCYAVMELSFAMAECASSGFVTFSAMVKRGEFDRVLVRPRSTILQVLGSRFEIERLGSMLSGCIMLGAAVCHHQIAWTTLRAFTLVLMIAGGMLLFSGLFMIGASICFFAVEESAVLNVLTYGGKEHGKYPIDVYGRRLFRFCTYIVPYTLVQYYPLQYLLGRSDNWAYALCPLGVGLFLLAAYAFWRVGVAHYTSAGS